MEPIITISQPEVVGGTVGGVVVGGTVGGVVVGVVVGALLCEGAVVLRGVVTAQPATLSRKMNTKRLAVSFFIEMPSLPMGFVNNFL